MGTATVVTCGTKSSALERKETVDLETLVKECEETNVSWGLMQNDIVFAVTFWAMVQSGFQPLTKKTVNDKSQVLLPANWKHQTRQVYEAEFILPPYFDNQVKLVALPAGDILCVNLFASNISPTNVSLRSLAIHSTGCVPRPDEATFMYKFSCFKDFHVLLRNAIIWPIRCSILTDQGVMNGSLRGLSDEIKLKIIRYLTVREILILGQTCHDLNRICNDQGLWKSIFHEKYKRKCRCSNDSETCDESSDWKELYKQTDVYTPESNSASVRNSLSESYHTPSEFPLGSEIDFSIE
ncbi:hypothetical protein RUM44_000647 [Polyplax serrata]|uniref:F-box domain-containing protein n=1 Tax=Polyplax serrata TaxID=468196 RepID=A0ABR1B6Y3_POLSC